MEKEHILNEIRRTAVEGKPLGRAQFLAQTGIKESDWLGKHWVRWSEVQAEAGFEPLSLNPALDDEQVFESILGLTRKLGRFPTTPEMRMERRTNNSFPNDKTIGARGNRHTIIERLMKYCREHTNFHDVEAILKSTPTKRDSSKVSEKPQQQGPDGAVYLIKAQGSYKIGSTRAVYRRAAEITNQSAGGAELLHHIATDDPEGIEKYWHERFAAKRIVGKNKQSGEWFALTAEDVRTFKRRKFM